MNEQKQLNDFDIAMDVIGNVSKLQEARRVKTETQEKFGSLLQVSKEKIECLDEVIAKYSVEELEQMTDEEISALYVVDGHELVLDLEVEKDKINEFKRDFLIYMKRLEVYAVEIDKTIQDLEKTLEEHQIEYNDLISKYGSMYLITKAKMEDIVANSEDDSQKTRAEAMLKSIDSAISLDVIIDYIEQFNFENMLNDFEKRGGAVYKKYKNVIKALGIRTDVTRLAALEELLGLEEEYLEYTNLPMFLVIRYVAYAKNPSKEVEGMFVSSLALIYRAIAEGTITDQDKERLTNACKTIIEKAISMKK